jgi:hypothetical protein
MPRPALVALALLSLPATAEEALPKLGPLAVPITAETEFLRSAPAPDYWAFAPFVRPQFTTSACGIATVTATLNGLRGLPALAEDAIPDQPALLDAIGDPLWVDLTAEGGDGLTFAQLSELALAGAAALEMEVTVTALPAAGTPDADLRALLLANEAGAGDAVMVYFNQGAITGDWDGPHIALIGAFDDATGRVLILEVDQEWYIPYWTDFDALLAAMRRPTSAEHGPLEGQTGGLVRVALGD